MTEKVSLQLFVRPGRDTTVQAAAVVLPLGIQDYAGKDILYSSPVRSW